MAGRPKRKADLAALDSLPKEHIVSMLEAGQPIARICYALGVGRVALEDWLNKPENEGLSSRARAKAMGCAPGTSI
jgi:DNA invertase Pin-like site-specific DNA recombinase